MKSNTEVDENFKVETNVEREGLKFFNPEKPPFKIYGVFREGDCLHRMPEETAKRVSEGVHYLHFNTAGGRVRFTTDSPYVAINAKLHRADPRTHFAHSGVAGFDIYAKTEGEQRYMGTLRPATHDDSSVEGIIELCRRGDKKLREITVNMPLYGGIKSLYIGLDENSKIEAPSEYRISKPVVYYGSSITQGGCASRPGMAYEAIISRALDCNFINLGFSGNAKGEQEMTDYIKGLDMSLFVMDYDHNAPTVEHLEATHEKMFKCIRKAQPELPVLIMSRPKYYLNGDEKKRLEIVKATYDNAVRSGDKNVYFIDGRTLMNDEIKGNGTVDGCHPTDLGFFSMAQRMIPIMKDILW